MRRRSFLAASVAVAGLAAASGTGLLWQRVYGRKRKNKNKPPKVQVEYTGPAAYLRELPDDASYDACIVGSGPAGTLLARELATSGIRTLIIEAGLTPSEASRDPRYFALNSFVNKGSIDYPLTMSRVMGIGGTTAIWTGRCPRLFPIDFERNAYTPPGAGWPITYDEIEPYYTRAETTLRVHGEQSDLVPRSAPIPFALNAPNDDLIKLLRSAGIIANNTPSSKSASGNGPVRVASEWLQEVASMPEVTLVIGATVRRFDGDASGRITTAVVRDMSGLERTIRARVFILAGGAVESARRLLLSRTPAYPNGVGNSTDLVGRTFGEHGGLAFSAILDVPRGQMKFGGSTVRSLQFYEAWKKEGYGSPLLGASVSGLEGGSFGLRRRVSLRLTGGLEMYPMASNRVTLCGDSNKVDPHGDALPELHFSFSPRDLATMDRLRRLIHDIYARLGAREVAELPIRWSHHHLGTVRMGADAHSGVVNHNLCVHGCPNLYVVSSGVFVTSGCSNPTLLITAFAHRLGEHLRQRFTKGDVPPLHQGQQKSATYTSHRA